MEIFTIVEANLQDFDGVKNLMLKALQTDPLAFSSDYSDYANNSNIWWQNYLYNYLMQNNAKLFVAKVNSEIKAMVGILLDPKNRRKHVGSVVWFYVEPESRAIGIGNKLFNTLIEYARSLGTIKKLTLLVNAPQQKAQEIYNKFGFKVVGTLKGELLVNNQFIDEYIMELFL